MAAVQRRPMRVVAALCALMAGTISYSTPSRANSPCAELREWAASAYSGRTPTLDELAHFDRAHRVAIFNTVSPPVRAALWREQLIRFSRTPELSATQRAVVEEGIALATPALYERSPAAVEAHRRLVPRIKREFSATQAGRRGWGDLGALGQPFRPAGAEAGCECNADPSGGGWWDCLGGTCRGGGCNWVWGCGPMGDQWCNGTCVS